MGWISVRCQCAADHHIRGPRFPPRLSTRPLQNQMTTPLPKNFPKPGWIQQFDADSAREFLPSEAELVPHPHYGRSPQLNGVPLKDAAQFGLYEYQPSWTFPTTRIVAVPSRQNYSQMPRPDYFDVLRKCRNCSRWFVFFAKEQQHWFEELQFFVDSACLQCAECRRHERHRKATLRRYAAMLAEPNPDAVQMTQLLTDTLYLYKEGVLHRQHQLDKVITKVAEILPSHEPLEEVRQLRRKLDLPHPT